MRVTGKRTGYSVKKSAFKGAVVSVAPSKHFRWDGAKGGEALGRERDPSGVKKKVARRSNFKTVGATESEQELKNQSTNGQEGPRSDRKAVLRSRRIVSRDH